jgi:hypothetical protein
MSSIDFTHAHREEAQHLRALHLILHHVAKLLRDRGIGEDLHEMVLVAEDEVQREHAGLRRHGRRVGGRRNDEVDVARPQLLQELRLLAELAARELVSAELAAREFFELVVEDVGGHTVRGRRRLVVREAELPRLTLHGGRCQCGDADD